MPKLQTPKDNKKHPCFLASCSEDRYVNTKLKLYKVKTNLGIYIDEHSATYGIDNTR